LCVCVRAREFVECVHWHLLCVCECVCTHTHFYYSLYYSLYYYRKVRICRVYALASVVCMRMCVCMCICICICMCM